MTQAVQCSWLARHRFNHHTCGMENGISRKENLKIRFTYCHSWWESMWIKDDVRDHPWLGEGHVLHWPFLAAGYQCMYILYSIYAIDSSRGSLIYATYTRIKGEPGIWCCACDLFGPRVWVDTSKYLTKYQEEWQVVIDRSLHLHLCDYRDTSDQSCDIRYLALSLAFLCAILKSWE